MFKYNKTIFAINLENDRKIDNLIDIPMSLTTAELYPRKRYSERYSQPMPRDEQQTRETEHPRRALELQLKQTEKVQTNHIAPPTNSNTKLNRDSYFS